MENKLLNVSNVKQVIGWAYSDFKWLTKKEAIRVNRERDFQLLYCSLLTNQAYERVESHRYPKPAT